MSGPVNDGVLGAARAALDPVLVPAGFLSAQGGEDGERGQVLWCGAYDDLARERPALTGGEQERGVGACVDLMIDLRRHAGQWRVTGVRVEVQPLAEVLRQTGDEAGATRADALDGASLEDALPALADLLTGLLR